MRLESAVIHVKALIETLAHFPWYSLQEKLIYAQIYAILMITTPNPMCTTCSGFGLKESINRSALCPSQQLLLSCQTFPKKRRVQFSVRPHLIEYRFYIYNIEFNYNNSSLNVSQRNKKTFNKKNTIRSNTMFKCS